MKTTAINSQGELATTTPSKVAGAKPERLLSLDAYRGAIMLMMASAGFGLSKLASEHAGSQFWHFIGYQVDHVKWAGCALWDMIQPAFMFMVGVALPWSLANRRARGESFVQSFGHALWRALALVLLAVFLTTNFSKQTQWLFTNVLAQIGLGYPFLFLLAYARPRTQWLAAFGILLGYWLLFALYPLPPADFNWNNVGVPSDWPYLTGLAAHWEKNYNFAASFDQWFLNLFRREKPFVFEAGGYQTLNFVPSLATMIFGVLAGQLLRSSLPVTEKLKRLAIFGVAGVLIGYGIGALGLCPLVKRIWTPSWAIYSGGWAALLLAGFVAVIDWQGWRKWAFPLIVVGLNPITLYCLWQLMSGFVRESVKKHFGQQVFESLGPAYVPMLERTTVLVVLWLILLWMYRRKIFLRI